MTKNQALDVWQQQGCPDIVMEQQGYPDYVMEQQWSCNEVASNLLLCILTTDVFYRTYIVLKMSQPLSGGNRFIYIKKQ